MSGGLDFREYVEHVRPSVLMFPQPTPPVLSPADMVDQCALIKQAFLGRWPHSG